MSNIKKFKLPDSVNQKMFISRISERYGLQRESTSSHTELFYDTFDWRLFSEGCYLVENRENLILFQLESDMPFEQSSPGGRKNIRFWWNLPPGTMKDKLKPLLEMRALLPLAKIRKEVLPLRLLNKDQKTVLIIHLEQIRLINNGKIGKSGSWLKLIPVKGYRKAARDFEKFISGLGLTKENKSVFQIAVEAAGKTPGDYSSKIKFVLEPSLPAAEAMRSILKRLLEIIKTNEPGIIEDLDTEFLHDFRVALRRTRSALSQVKGVFPQEIAGQFKKDFDTIAKSTNRMRDLDVYLLNEENYRDMLPEHLRYGLNLLFAKLSRQRRVEYGKITKLLNSEFYKNVIYSWGVFLTHPEDSDAYQAPNSQLPINTVAKKHIYRRFLKVQKMGGKISRGSADKYLHQLRIECKKLRYLLEFFASLFPQREMSLLIKHLKKLQDNLGAFNDYSVQQKMLADYLDALTPDKNNKKLTAAAIGGLITELHNKQIKTRNNFKRIFAEFNSTGNTELFYQLFGAEQSFQER